MQPQRHAAPHAKAQGALLVDDDKFMLTVLGDMLRELGVCGISTAANGDDAVQALDRMALAPDLTFCDLNMPGSDGFQFMEALGKRGYTGGIVLVSGMDARTLNSASLMARFHRLNIIGSLTKPIDASALRQTLSQAV